MDSSKPIETNSVSVPAQVTDGGLHTESVKLIEMGDVSAETKGFYRGLEIGFFPRS